MCPVPGNLSGVNRVRVTLACVDYIITLLWLWNTILMCPVPAVHIKICGQRTQCVIHSVQLLEPRITIDVSRTGEELGGVDKLRATSASTKYSVNCWSHGTLLMCFLPANNSAE